MKISNKIMTFLLSAVLLFGIAGCSDDDNDVMPDAGADDLPEFILEQESIKVKIGSETKVLVEVKQGGGEYNAFVLDERLAKAEVADGVIKVEGFANGQTSLIVSDKYSRYRKLPVSVYTTDKLQLSHENFDLVTPLGHARTLSANVVLGNGGYEAVSDNENVSVSVDEDGVISLTATSSKAEFDANVTVTDCTGLSASIAVKVVATLEAFTDEDIEAIKADDSRRYYFNNNRTDQYYYTYLNVVTEDGKQRYGWKYYSYYWCYIDFSGDKSVGEKEGGEFTYKTWGTEINTPITLKIIKNDGTNIWGVFSYVDETEEKLCYGYFCDTVNPE